MGRGVWGPTTWLRRCGSPPFPSLHGDRPGLQAQPPLLHIQPSCYHGNRDSREGRGWVIVQDSAKVLGAGGSQRTDSLLPSALWPCLPAHAHPSVALNLCPCFHVSHSSLQPFACFSDQLPNLPHLPPMLQAHTVPLACVLSRPVP